MAHEPQLDTIRHAKLKVHKEVTENLDS